MSLNFEKWETKALAELMNYYGIPHPKPIEKALLVQQLQERIKIAQLLELKSSQLKILCRLNKVSETDQCIEKKELLECLVTLSTSSSAQPRNSSQTFNSGNLIVQLAIFEQRRKIASDSLSTLFEREVQAFPKEMMKRLIKFGTVDGARQELTNWVWKCILTVSLTMWSAKKLPNGNKT
jgi:hypothetical protein